MDALMQRAPLPYDPGSVVQFNKRYKTRQGLCTTIQNFCEDGILERIEEGSTTVMYSLNADGDSFLRDCMNGTVVESVIGDRTVKVLKLGRTGHWRFHGDETPSTSSIFLPEIFEKLKIAISTSLQNDFDNHSSTAAYVTGSPGTGKSTFMYYVLHHLLHPSSQNETIWVVYQPYPETDTTEVYWKGGFYMVTSRGKKLLELTDTLHFLASTHNDMDGRGLLVVDTNIPWWRNNPIYNKFFSKLVVSSFGQAHRNETLAKYVNRDVTLHIVLPPWNIQDLQDLRSLCYSEFSDAHVERCYRYFGGKVRYIFNKRTQYMSDEKLTSDILSTIRSTDISLALKTIGGNMIRDIAYIGLLFALKSVKYPEQCEDGTWKNRIEDGELSWASEFIEKCVCEEILSTELHKLRLFLEIGTTVPVVQSLRGRVFENMVHRYVCSKATSWRIKCLHSEKNTTTSDEFFQLPAMAEHHFTNVNEIDPHAYNIPLDSTFAGVDAILPSKGLLFQVTVSGQHPVKASALERLELCFSDYVKKTKQPVKLVFVTDGRRFPEYKLQSYHDVTGHTLKTSANKRLPWIEQWVWEFDFEGLNIMKRKCEAIEDDPQHATDEHVPKRRSKYTYCLEASHQPSLIADAFG